MNKTDIKRLKKCVEFYDRIIDALDRVYDSLDKKQTEYLHKKDRDISTTTVVRDFYHDAKQNRMWLDSTIKQLDES